MGGARSPAGARRSKIFVVEDHARMRQMMLALIERMEGVESCGAAGTAEEALELLQACKPDLVLADISLPGMDGISLIKKLGAEWPDLAVLAISAYDDALYAMGALQAGARGYVAKADALQVTQAIRSILAGEVYLSERIRSRLADAP
jgi:DNA-binding NarL/FixJ family response regulator